MKPIIIAVLMIMVIVSGCSKKEEKETLSWQPTVTLAEPVTLDDTLTLSEIAQGIIVVEHRYPWSSNSLIVELEDKSILWVDTPCTPDATAKVLQWIRSSYGEERVITEINTGYHFDNLGGNGVLTDAGIDIYASEMTGTYIEQKGEGARQQFLDLLQGEENKIYYDTYANLQYVEPCAYIKMTVGEEKSMHIKEGVEIYYPGKSHAPDNIVVYIEDRKVLFGGCMIKYKDAKDLGNVADADLTEWPKSLEKLKLKYTEELIEYVIPGHGGAGSYELIENTLNLCK